MPASISSPRPSSTPEAVSLSTPADSIQLPYAHDDILLVAPRYSNQVICTDVLAITRSEFWLRLART